MSLDIRQARLEEAEIMAQILTDAVNYKMAHDDKVWGDEPYTATEVEGRISDGTAYIAWLDDTAVATFMLTWQDEMVWGKQPPVAGYVHQLAVSDGYHGQGIGGEVLDWAGKRVAEEGRQFLRIDFQPLNLGLKSYYEKMGFRWVRDQEVKAPQGVYTASLYERPVN